MQNSANNQHALLSFDGPDAARLLQGQFTCDVESIAADEWRYGACCDAKGRMVANFIITRQQDRFLLRADSSVIPVLEKHIAKYAVFYKVKIEQPQAVLLARKTVAHEEGAISGNQVVINDHGLVLFHHSAPDAASSDPDWQEHWLLDSSADNARNDEQGEADFSPRQWADIEMQQGITWVSEATSGRWIPQHIGWDTLGGISFSKGCYTGQEVVARVQYLGKAKKQLARLELQTPEEQSPELLGTVRSDEGKALGELASWNGNQGLAVMNQFVEQATAVIQINDTPHTVSLTWPLRDTDD